MGSGMSALGWIADRPLFAVSIKIMAIPERGPCVRIATVSVDSARLFYLGSSLICELVP